MDAKKLISITKEFDISDIEKHIFWSYIKLKNIDYQSSNLLKNYYDDFVEDEKLSISVDKLCLKELHEISTVMEILMPTVDKKLNGAFFTPSYIVDYIIETIAPRESDICADISCGSGAFLLGLIRYFSNKFNKSIVSIVKDNIYGVDIIDYNVRRAKVLIELTALEKGESVHNEMNIFCDDSLALDWSQKFDVIVGNPPYVKFQDLDESSRKSLLNKWETTKFGTFNLYFAFFEIGKKLLKRDGLLGYITPNNYFTSLAGETLRNYFSNHQCIYKIADFNSTKVFDVQTYTAITFLNSKKNDFIEYACIEDNMSPQSFLANARFSKNKYSDLNAKKWRLLNDDDRSNIYNIENSGDSLGSLFDICAGIATLKDDAYFIDPISVDDSYYTFTKKGVTFKIEKEITRDLVKIADMKDQETLNNNQRKIIFPYRYVNAKASVISVDEMKAHYPLCYEYLLSVKELLDTRDKGKASYNPFYTYGRSQGLNRNGVKLLTPTFSKFPRFLLDTNESSFFTNGYGVFLKPTNAIFSNPITEQIDVIQKILNSSVMHYYVKKTSVSIEGGYPCYQKNFIERFTIPHFTIEEINKMKTMDKVEIDKYLIERYHLNIPLPNRCS